MLMSIRNWCERFCRVLAFSFVLTLAMSFLISTVFAQDFETYRVEEIGLNLYLPTDCFTFTPDMPFDDPNFDLFNIDGEEAIKNFKAQNILLDAFPADVNYEILVSELTGEEYEKIGSYRFFSDDFVISLCTQELNYDIDGINYTLSEWEIVKTSDAKYFKAHLNADNTSGGFSIIQYHTVHDGKAINIAFHTFTAAANAEQRQLFEEIVINSNFPPLAKSEDTKKVAPLPEIKEEDNFVPKSDYLPKDSPVPENDSFEFGTHIKDFYWKIMLLNIMLMAVIYGSAAIALLIAILFVFKLSKAEKQYALSLLQVCPHCGATQNIKHKFCSECSMKLQ